MGEQTCAIAAKGGHLEVLIWLREKKCPWDEQTYTNAVQCGNPEVFEWVRTNGTMLECILD